MKDHTVVIGQHSESGKTTGTQAVPEEVPELEP